MLRIRNPTMRQGLATALDYFMVDVTVLDNHHIGCVCEACESDACIQARNAFFKDIGVHTIGEQRAAFVEFYLLWFSCDDDEDEDDE